VLILAELAYSYVFADLFVVAAAKVVLSSSC